MKLSLADLCVHSCPAKRSYLLYPVHVGHTRIARNVHSSPHLHPVYHLTLVLKGESRLETNSGVHSLKSGDVIIINPGEKHIFSTGEDSLYYFTFNFWLLPTDALENLDLCLSIEEQDLEQLAATNPIQNLFPIPVEGVQIRYLRSRWPEVVRLIEGYASIPEHKRRAHDQGIRFFSDLIGLLFGPEPEAPADPFVRKALHYLDAHINETFSLKKMARDFCLAPAYLCCRFKEKTGTTLGQVFRQRKIEIACELLLKTEMSVTDIAYQLSFSSSQHFSIAFKFAKGKTPRDYRRAIEPQ